MLSRGATRLRTRRRSGVTSARQPGSTTVVAFLSAMMAGPSICWPMASASRKKIGVESVFPPVVICAYSTAPRGARLFRLFIVRRFGEGVRLGNGFDGDRFDDDLPIRHQEAEAPLVCRLEVRRMSAISPNGVMSAVSVPS